jgi:hypothetical protein
MKRSPFADCWIRAPTLPPGAASGAELTCLMDTAGAAVLAYMGFPAQHRANIHSTNPIERLNGEIKRYSDAVGIFQNEAAVTRLIGALLLEQNDEWAVQHARYMTLETNTPLDDDRPVSLPPLAAGSSSRRHSACRCHTMGWDTIFASLPRHQETVYNCCS